MVKEEGGSNDLLDRIVADSSFGLTRKELDEIVKPEKYTGRSAEQTVEFVENCVKPALAKLDGEIASDFELTV